MKGILWNNVELRAIPVAICAALLAGQGCLFAQTSNHTPQLLLSTKRLRRLQRDRERQTPRWLNFETRVKTVPDSPERGFELALYYAVTGDEERGREAIQWGLAHACRYRERALILDWVASLISDQDRQALTGRQCKVDYSSNIFRLRDSVFTKAAMTEDPGSGSPDELLHGLLEFETFRKADVLYAACEYLVAGRIRLEQDEDRKFFASLPTEFLLSLKPDQVEHPDWMTHIAALALVDLNPNLESSQYLQGWAMEDREMLREGPGVAYEFLWADPYLPGVGYQNLEPWIYDPAGRLFARTDWNEDACWVEISNVAVQDVNCPPMWRQTTTSFGHLTLIPMVQPCIQVPRRKENETAILWKFHPHQTVTYLEGKTKRTAEADATGMWRMPREVEGKVCAAP